MASISWRDHGFVGIDHFPGGGPRERRDAGGDQAQPGPVQRDDPYPSARGDARRRSLHSRWPPCLVLTPAGETLLPYAERLLALAEEARHAVSENRPQGRLRLGTMESTAASRLPRVLAAYHQRWPQVTLELTTGVTDALIDSVRTFEVDAAMIARPIHPDALPAGQFDFVPVFEEELVLLTPRGRPPSATAHGVAGLTLVAFERGCAYRTYAMRWYELQGIRPARVLELGSYHAIVACVAAGAGVAVAPRSVLELSRLDGGEVDVHPIGALGHVTSLLVWRKGHFSAALNALRDLLVKGRPVLTEKS